MEKLNVAIIGQGRSGRDIHGNFFRSAENTKYTLKAVVDAIPERRERAKAEYGCDVYASYQELFDRKDIDLVVNSTFSHLHIPVTIDLLNHGFHVISEKPFAKTYEDGCRAILVAKENGKMLNVFQQSRFAPAFRKVQEVLTSGKLGTVMQINLHYNSFGRRWDWQTSQAYAGGSVRNSGPHPLDQALCLLGFPEKPEVYSKLGRAVTYGDAEDWAKIMLTAPDKPLIDLEISSCDCFNDYSFLIMGTNGCLKSTLTDMTVRSYDPAKAPEHYQIMEPLRHADGTPAYCSEELDWQEEQFHLEGNVFGSAVRMYYDMIYDHLVNGAEMEITPEQVLTQLKVIDLIHAQNPLSVF